MLYNKIIVDLHEVFVLLSKKDSNPHWRNQNPTCYHYTIGQLRIASAKLVIIFIIASEWREKSSFGEKFLPKSSVRWLIRAVPT